MDNTFSFNTLSELINIDEHINFAESILNKYSWDAKVKQKLSGQLSRIKSKKDDEHLNISIVGEFSSGKSTFINALIKEDSKNTAFEDLLMEFYDDAKLNIKNDDVKLLKHRLQKNDLVMTSKSSKVKRNR